MLPPLKPVATVGLLLRDVFPELESALQNGVASVGESQNAFWTKHGVSVPWRKSMKLAPTAK
jgi:hypothetical protein